MKIVKNIIKKVHNYKKQKLQSNKHDLYFYKKLKVILGKVYRKPIKSALSIYV